MYGLWNLSILCLVVDSESAPLIASALAKAKLTPDLCYIDADHHYEAAKKDIRNCLTLFPKAIIVGDDYNYPSVKQAVDEIASEFHLQVTSCFGTRVQAHLMFFRFQAMHFPYCRCTLPAEHAGPTLPCRAASSGILQSLTTAVPSFFFLTNAINQQSCR